MLKNNRHILISKYKYLFIAAFALYVLSLFTQQKKNQEYLPQQVQKKFQQQLNNKEQGFARLLENKLFLNECNAQTNNSVFTNVLGKQYGLFLYSIKKDSGYTLKAWSNNNYHLNDKDINETDSNYIVNYENGTFEIIRKKIGVDKNLLLIATVPIKWKYFIKNKYLPSKFDGLNNYEKYFEISEKPTDIPINSINGKPLFFLKKTESNLFFSYDWGTIILRLSALILFLIFIYNKAVQLISHIGFIKSFGLFLLILSLFRAVIYFVNVPFNLAKIALFDPSVYASNALHPSLGDLIINLILLYLFLHFYEKNKTFNAITSKRKYQKNIQFKSLAFVTIVSFIFSDILKSLVIDSKISFDVSNFFSLNIFSALAFLTIGFLFVIYYKIASLFINPIHLKSFSLANQLLAISATSIAIITFKSLQIDYNIQSSLVILAWVLLFVYLFQKINISNKSDSKSNIAIPLIWTIYFTTSASALIVINSKILEIEQRKKIAENIFLQTDATTENLLNIATTGFNDVFFQNNFSRFSNPKTITFIKDSLIAENFSGYLNKLETNIYLFDKNCKPIFNNDSSTVDRWNKSITTLGKSIGLDGLFSISNSSLGNSYIYKKLIVDKDEQLLCQLFILLHPKKNKNKGVLPELFHQGQDADLQFTYPFALYDSGRLSEQNGNYNFAQNTAKINQMFAVENNNSESILTYQPTNFSSVIVVKNTRTVLDFITLFAYLFFSFLFVILLLYLFNLPIQKFGKNFKIFKLDIRNQIRATIVFTSITSFIIIAIVTIVFFINKFNQASQDRLVKSINYSAVEIENSLSKKDTINNSKIEDLLQRLSEQQGLDFNLFDSKGSLITTTQPYIYNRKLVDSRMNPIAFQKIYIATENSFKQEEKIGLLPFLSLYKPIINDDGKIIACVNIPYLNSEAELNQEISGFIATLMNLNAFIFLIAGAIAYLITNRITSSFKLIKEKMKAVNWQSHNDEILWNKDDEIGALVKEYNIMVKKLDETAKAFALSQREKAWKEMAMQVAHEIKNPLTPMKLSIQYLQKNIDDNAPNIKELSRNVATTLVEQIDQLTTIASEFSQFANIGNNNIEKVNINSILTSLINLYIGDDKIKIEHNILDNEFYINADKIQIMRLFTNLIKNAIEASVKNETIKINIEQTVTSNSIITSIKDEGSGISEELQQKIFTLNFTTKSSGTGLGLAICKGIAENSNGKIWFNTSTKGTTFFVELPLV